ncbi:MAG: hypothetical protein RIQ53_4187 [Pseudomonadota bacterium]|jgi:hypothetical protein
MADRTSTLTTDELRAITGKARPPAQAVVLARRGIAFRFTGDAVHVERAVADAYALLPQRGSAGGVDLSKVR